MSHNKKTSANVLFLSLAYLSRNHLEQIACSYFLYTELIMLIKTNIGNVVTISLSHFMQTMSIQSRVTY